MYVTNMRCIDKLIGTNYYVKKKETKPVIFLCAISSSNEEDASCFTERAAGRVAFSSNWKPAIHKCYYCTIYYYTCAYFQVPDVTSLGFEKNSSFFSVVVVCLFRLSATFFLCDVCVQYSPPCSRRNWLSIYISNIFLKRLPKHTRCILIRLTL